MTARQREQAVPAGRRSLAAALGRALLVALLLYVFFLSIELMGLAFKLFGKGFATELMTRAANPFVGLVVGILATSLVQSSSTTTSMVVGLVAAGALSIEGAIPIVMGANIGTSVTNSLVSLGHVTRREEFRRAFAGATVHDFFNWLTVLVLFPVELATGYLAKTAGLIEQAIEGVGGVKLFDPLKPLIKPVAKGVSQLLGDSAALTLIAALLLLFLALKFLVDLLKALVASRAERMLDRTLFRSAFAAIGAGALITAMVQSSSITTSIMVPMVGAGVVTLEQVYPFTIGANIGTTVTAMLAALATGQAAAVSVALAHLLFNLTGAAIFYPLKPLRALPLALARGLGNVAARSRPLAFAYIAFAFFGLPALLLTVTGSFGGGAAAPEPPPAQTAPAEAAPAAAAKP